MASTPGAGALYVTGLAQFLQTRFTEWEKEKANLLVPRLQAALDAMNFKDDQRFPAFKSAEGQGWRSQDYLPLIKVKVMTAFTTVVDILLQGGEVPFALKPSPYSGLNRLPQNEVERRIKVMVNRIREHLRDRKADRHYLKKLYSLVLYGMAFSKYNVMPVERKGYKEIPLTELLGVQPGVAPAAPGVEDVSSGVFMPYTESVLVPGHTYVSVWDVFWDMEFESVQEGSGIFERTFVTPYEVRQLLNAPPDLGYVEEHLRRVLVASYRDTTQITDTSAITPGLREIQKRRRNIPRKEYWGRAPRTLVEEFQRRASGDYTFNAPFNAWDDGNEGDDVEIMAEMLDDEVVRLHTDVPDKRPYKKCIWEDELDTGNGVGIPENLAHVQRIYVGLMRAFIDNKKLSANVILATKRNQLVDPDAVRDLRPGSEIEVLDSCEDANKAVKQIVIADVGATLLDGIGIIDRWKDTASLIPEILQGATLPKQQPDTAYELSQLQENAGRYLAMGIKNIDEYFIEDEIYDIYDYVMQYDPDPNLKGDYVVHATGFQTFKDRVLRGQRIKELLALVASSPVLAQEARLRRYLEEIHRTMDVDPDEFLKTEEEKARDAQVQAQAEEEARRKALADAQALSAVEQEGKTRQAEEQFQREVLRDSAKTAAGREDMAYNALINSAMSGTDLAAGGPPNSNVAGKPPEKS